MSQELRHVGRRVPGVLETRRHLVPKVGQMEVLQPGPLPRRFPRRPNRNDPAAERPNTCASGPNGCPSGPVRRICSTAPSRVEMGSRRARRVFAFSARITSSRPARSTSPLQRQDLAGPATGVEHGHENSAQMRVRGSQQACLVGVAPEPALAWRLKIREMTVSVPTLKGVAGMRRWRAPGYRSSFRSWLLVTGDTPCARR